MSRPLGSAYELEEPIGRGAMGEVWRGRVVATGEAIAAKLLRPEYTEDQDVLTRFVQERAILTSLRHPNLVQVRDLVVEGVDLAIVMDLVDGPDLGRYLRDRGRLAPAEAVQFTIQVLEALAVTHAARVLHRDVKPDNVLVDLSGPTPQMRLSDFGIARLAEGTAVRVSQLIGTAEYLAPEVVAAEIVSPAADVYASGVLLYELLAGRTPFAGGSNSYAITARHVQAAPPPLVGVPERLGEVVSSLLAKDPAARPNASAAAALLRDLAAGLAGLPALPNQPAVSEWDPAGAADATTGSVTMAPGQRQRDDEPAGDAPVFVPVSSGADDGRPTRAIERPLVRPRPGPDVPDAPPIPTDDGTRRRTVLLALGGVAAVALVGWLVASRPAGDEPAAPSTEPDPTVEPDRQEFTMVDITRTYEFERSGAEPRLVAHITYESNAGALNFDVREYVIPHLADGPSFTVEEIAVSKTDGEGSDDVSVQPLPVQEGGFVVLNDVLDGRTATYRLEIPWPQGSEDPTSEQLRGFATKAAGSLERDAKNADGASHDLWLVAMEGLDVNITKADIRGPVDYSVVALLRESDPLTLLSFKNGVQENGEAGTLGLKDRIIDLSIGASTGCQADGASWLVTRTGTNTCTITATAGDVSAEGSSE